MVRRVRRGDVQRRFERAADEAVFARVFQRDVYFFAHADEVCPVGGVKGRVVAN